MEDDFQIEFMSLPLEDLQDNYGKLLVRYRQKSDDAEADTQRIHELKRSLETAHAAKNYLSQEVEELMQTLASIENDNKEQIKLLTELEDLRRKHHILTTDYTTLQQDYAALSIEHAEMRKHLETVKSAKILCKSSIIDARTKELTHRIATMEAENCSLMQKLEEFQESMVRQTLALAERESNIEILRDQVTCLEENLRSKLKDLDEKTNLLDNTQEYLEEANSRIALLETKPGAIGRKGNSLFAEVNYQRLTMKKVLSAQKKRYINLKKICKEDQSKITRFERECASSFCPKHHACQNKLNERILQLLGQVEGLEKQLELSQSQLSYLANSKGLGWLDSMLSFCKHDANNIKKQLHSVRIQKLDSKSSYATFNRRKQDDSSNRSKRVAYCSTRKISGQKKIEFKPFRGVCQTCQFI